MKWDTPGTGAKPTKEPHYFKRNTLLPEPDPVTAESVANTVVESTGNSLVNTGMVSLKPVE